MYQIFSSLLGHLQFFVHFFFTFMEQFFIGHPIYRPMNTGRDAWEGGEGGREAKKGYTIGQTH